MPEPMKISRFERWRLSAGELERVDFTARPQRPPRYPFHHNGCYVRREGKGRQR